MHLEKAEQHVRQDHVTEEHVTEAKDDEDQSEVAQRSPRAKRKRTGHGPGEVGGKSDAIGKVGGKTDSAGDISESQENLRKATQEEKEIFGGKKGSEKVELAERRETRAKRKIVEADDITNRKQTKVKPAERATGAKLKVKVNAKKTVETSYPEGNKKSEFVSR